MKTLLRVIELKLFHRYQIRETYKDICCETAPTFVSHGNLMVANRSGVLYFHFLCTHQMFLERSASEYMASSKPKRTGLNQTLLHLDVGSLIACFFLCFLRAICWK